MPDDPALIRSVKPTDLALLSDWRWLLPEKLTPLFLTAFGDWIFGAPDGSHWLLEMLEGSLSQIAATGAEYNEKKNSESWRDKNLLGGWFVIALGNGLAPTEQQCIGWAKHPLLGGAFKKTNLKLFDASVYQSLMGQLHRRLQRR